MEEAKDNQMKPIRPCNLVFDPLNFTQSRNGFYSTGFSILMNEVVFFLCQRKNYNIKNWKHQRKRRRRIKIRNNFEENC
jgi:hypothetical protein